MNQNHGRARRFDGQVAVVTGAAHGIGRAVADQLASEGAAVACLDLDVRDDLWSRSCDVTDTAAVDAAVAAVHEELGGIDVLITVAGGAHDHPMLDVADADWQRELDLNLTSSMRCVRAALPHLGSGAAVVFVSSVNGLTAFGNEPYSAAKAGLSSYARNLAVQLGPRGIRVNVVAPGTVRTRVWDGQPHGPDQLVPLIPLGRVGEPADIAAAVAFLVSAEAAWITGVTLPVDGGVLAGPAQVLDRITS